MIDTGVRPSHNEFGGRAVADPASALNGGIDDNGHGTHCAGTIAGKVVGVAKQAQIRALKALDSSGSGLDSDIIASINHILANRRRPDLLSMSIGGSPDINLDNAVNSAVAAGLPVIVAAGNDGMDACGFSPSRASSAFAVGAVQPHPGNDNLKDQTSYSNYGACVSIYAPGGDAGSLSPQRQIESSWWSGDNDYNLISGTSMATPHVAGLAAAYLGGHSSSTPTQVYNALLQRASSNTVVTLSGSSVSQPYAQGIGAAGLGLFGNLGSILAAIIVPLVILTIIGVAIGVCVCCICKSKRAANSSFAPSNPGPAPPNPYYASQNAGYGYPAGGAYGGGYNSGYPPPLYPK